VARAGGGWDPRAADDIGRRGDDASVAAGATRRPGRPVYGERQLHEPLARRAAAAYRHAHIVQRGGFHGRYLPSGLGSPKRAEREGGHLTWMQNGTLFAAPFDLATLAVIGSAVPVVQDVVSDISANTQVDVSRNGTLVYLSGSENASSAPLEWLSRDGKTTPLGTAPAPWSGVQIAPPDGRRLAFSLRDAAKEDVWTYDVARDALTRLTLGPSPARNPVRTPDGQRLVYSALRGSGTENLHWQRADGSGDATRLTTSPNPQSPVSWHPSGRFLAFQESRPQTGADLLILPVERDEAGGWKPGTPTVFLAGPFAEQLPRFSPDGRWLAYESNESGRVEIYVRPFPGPGAKWPLSTGGGTNAVWSRARRELLYLAPGRTDHGGAIHGRRRCVSSRGTARLERDASPSPAWHRRQLRSASGRQARGDGAEYRRAGRPDARDADLQLLRRAAARGAGDAMSLSRRHLR
jgi:hypothetical protein